MRATHAHLKSSDSKKDKVAAYSVLALAVAVAIVGARDHAGGWNDGSRLATVECLVDAHTWAIDHSVFVDVPYDRLEGDEPFPYARDELDAWIRGTQDKVLIDGHYYSHKPPVPALLMAGCYAAWEACTGGTARDRCDEFCCWMTLISSGGAYVIAVVTMFYLGGALGLSLADRLLLTGSFGLTTVAPVYSRNVNDHILLLVVATLLAINLLRLAQTCSEGTWRRDWLRVAGLGGLAGLGYTIDLGAGPMLLAATFVLVALRLRGQVTGIGLFLSGALPWVLLHHALNYAIGGTLAPLGSTAEFFDWPGTPFQRETLTGFWNHASLRGFAFYLAAMLASPERGFLTHNLPLLLLLPGMFTLYRRRVAEWPEVLALAGWAAGTWLLYGALSVNFSGDCCSIRWFVPLLAAGYVPLGVLVRDSSGYRRGLRLLSAAGLPLAAMMWWQGPWSEPQTRYFILCELAGVAIWLGWWFFGCLSAISGFSRNSR
ncbi:MAG TPA: hypothetical protein VG826_24205 [Pirellulales bacterium]|nr:hypothetical protein [Pirellulales bacterium]